MIKVTVYRTEGHEYTGFDAEGHAGFQESGRDIVCAAASVLIINTINSIEKFTNDKTSCVHDEDEGRIQFCFDGVAGHDAHILLQAMVLGLESIEDDKDYNPYIDIIFKEV